MRDEVRNQKFNSNLREEAKLLRANIKVTKILFHAILPSASTLPLLASQFSQSFGAALSEEHVHMMNWRDWYNSMTGKALDFHRNKGREFDEYVAKEMLRKRQDYDWNPAYTYTSNWGYHSFWATRASATAGISQLGIITLQPAIHNNARTKSTQTWADHSSSNTNIGWTSNNATYGSQTVRTIWDCLLNRTAVEYQNDHPQIGFKPVQYILDGMTFYQFYDSNNFAWFLGCPDEWSPKKIKRGRLEK
ncbi:uncharacterized protein DFL_002471 [Arthrobotrys flagrans]|uniref:Uncharacterized protein n=1 Tax=Arthrobotrys flagrans TaxID=97331 RepID=A0A437AAX2_ARTFL|nr:hypothetical protein DFL_002471 [Arthrobotrys flagrans]